MKDEDEDDLTKNGFSKHASKDNRKLHSRSSKASLIHNGFDVSQNTTALTLSYASYEQIILEYNAS